MMARTTTMVRFLLATLILLFLFTGINAQAQSTRATVSAQPEAARVPPPGDDDPPQPPFNAATPVNQSVPGSMTAGGVYTVTINMKNTGNTTWTSGTAYSLGSRNPFDNATWGGGRVGLPGDIPPGGFAQFTFQVTAPAAAGSYNFQWGMVQDGVEWFGTPSDNVVINVVAAPRNGSQFVTQSVPASMTTGAQYPVSLTFSNTGNTTWDPTNGKYVLLAVNPVNNETWVYSRIPLSGPVAPGQQTTVAWTTRAPSTPGTYNFQWIILQEGVELIGTPSTNVAVVVSAPLVNGAAFVDHSVPATMTPGQNYTATVIMQNTGTTTWSAHGDRGLASANPLANNTWNVVRIDQPTTTAPGQTATYTFTVTAPSTPGTYNFQWKMVQDQIEWFGAETPNLVIQVATPGDTVTYIHTDALGSPVARSDSAGNVISRTSYEPYGRTASGVTPTIGFTGHVNDADTGLVYMQQRYYDPVAGRFLSVDPVTTDANTGGSFNRYVYANNSPYKYIDPDGRDSREAQIDSELEKNNKNNCGAGQCGFEVSGGRPLRGEALVQSLLPKMSDFVSNMCVKAEGGVSICIGPASIASESAIAAKAVIPLVENSKLGNLIGDLFKGARTSNPIGTGSTADAIRNELRTGEMTAGKFHSVKGAEYARALDKWLEKNLGASFYDRLVAKSLRDDLIDALGGDPWKLKK